MVPAGWLARPESPSEQHHLHRPQIPKHQAEASLKFQISNPKACAMSSLQEAREGLSRLLTEPSFAAAARDLAAEVAAMPPPSAVVPLLEEIAAG